MEVERIAAQVLRNCRISDSRHAGLYSICGLAMRMRDLYKWENGLDPWVERDSSKVLEWIGEKEDEWENLVDQEFEDITILGKRYDPFDAKGINTFLEPRGLFYGAGYAGSLRPTFFLADLEEKKGVDGHRIYILGREKARDLLTLPALVQDDCILIRKESGILFFWDQIFFIKDSGRRALAYALKSYGLNERDTQGLRKNLRKIFSDEMDSYIHHELGEIRDDVFIRDLWREIIAAFPHTPIELLARTIKDLLADTNDYGTLQYIIRNRKAASLAFYTAFLEGLAKELFAGLPGAFSEFSQSNDWRIIDQAVSSGYGTFKHYAETMIEIYREGRIRNDMEWTAKEVEERLLIPLGLGRVNGGEDRYGD